MMKIYVVGIFLAIPLGYANATEAINLQCKVDTSIKQPSGNNQHYLDIADVQIYDGQDGLSIKYTSAKDSFEFFPKSPLSWIYEINQSDSTRWAKIQTSLNDNPSSSQGKTILKIVINRSTGSIVLTSSTVVRNGGFVTWDIVGSCEKLNLTTKKF
jgi:hypothetical protein